MEVTCRVRLRDEQRRLVGGGEYQDLDGKYQCRFSRLWRLALVGARRSALQWRHSLVSRTNRDGKKVALPVSLVRPLIWWSHTEGLRPRRRRRDVVDAKLVAMGKD